MKITLRLGMGVAAVSGLLAMGATAQQPAVPGEEQVVVTVLGRKGHTAPAVAQNQVSVQQGHVRDAITGWQALTGADSRVDLGLVIDDDSRALGSRLDDIKSFIASLPPTTAVALVYLRTGTAEIAQPLTLDHARAVKALRVPSGAADVSPSPYGSLRYLLSHWPRHPDRRREMIMLSDGEEHIGGNNSNNTTFQAAVADAVESGVVVYTIYVTGATAPMAANTLENVGVDNTPEFGTPLGGKGAGTSKLSNLGDNASNTANGSVNLALLSEATGGEAYTQGNVTPTRFKPFLDDIAARLQSQYRLRFTPAAGTPGQLVGIKVEVKDAPQAVITAPKQIALPKN